jgi:hypothetical protein
VSAGQILERLSCFSHTHSLAFFCAIPIVVAVIQAVNIPWGVVGALVLIGIGVITLVQAFYLREE